MKDKKDFLNLDDHTKWGDGFCKFIEPDQVRLIELLMEKSFRTGNFILSSGKESNFYVDVRQMILHSEGALLIAKLIFLQLKTDVVGIGGPASGADPITGATVLYSHTQGRPIDGFMVRKKQKEHGTKQWIEGLNNFPPGSKVCVVEDTISTGRSLLKAIQKIEEAGLNVVQCIAVVDREDGAAERIKAAGYPFEALVSCNELTNLK